MNRTIHCILTGIKVVFDKRNKIFYKVTLKFKFKDTDNKLKILKRSINMPNEDIINTLNSLSNNFRILKKSYCNFNLPKNKLQFYLLIDEKAEIIAISDYNKNISWNYVIN